MTEYTGWDNYIELKRMNEQYKQIKEEWKGAVDEYFGVERTEKNNWGVLKDLDKRVYHIKGHVDTLHERINNITDCGHRKLKQMVTPLNQANVIGRIEALEDFRRNHSGEFHVGKDLGHIYAAKAIDELQKQVKELQEWRNNPPTRLGELEQKYSTIASIVHNDRDRLDKLEEWRNNLGKIEPYHYSVIDKVKELETNYEHLKIRDDLLKDDLEELKEWQRSHEYKLHGCDGDRHKVIDKQVWEDIKTQIVTLSKFVYGISIEKLLDDIKKVDPEWESDKK